jgi:hypothetical protein
MQKKIELMKFSQLNCKVSIKNYLAEVFFLKDIEGKLMLNDVLEAATKEEWNNAKFIVLDVLNNSSCSMALTLEFWDKDNESMTGTLISTIGLLPGVKTRVAFPLEALNSQNMFLDRTPGILKTVIHGNKVHNLTKLAIGKKKCSYDQSMEISNIYLTSTQPEYQVPDLELVDEIGQWKINEWSGKTSGIDELEAYLNAEFSSIKDASFFNKWDSFGGWKDNKFNATGYFRTEHDGQRWWIVDPEGNSFLSIGVDCIGPGEGGNIKGIEGLFTKLPDKNSEYAEAWGTGGVHKSFPHFSFYVANLIRAFGVDWKEKWSELTKKRLIGWGINTIGNWSSLDFIRYAKLPYVLPLRDFPQTEKKIFRDFPDVFSEEYRNNSEIFAQQLVDFKNDKYMIGYFLRNEPTWAFINRLIIAEELLENKEQFYTKDAFIDFISQRYENDISKLNIAWKTSFSSFEILKLGIKKASKFSNTAEKDLKDFSKIMIELYVKIPSKAVKAVDANHLNLGMRYGYISSEEVLSGSEYFDVFSVNCYDVNPTEAVEKIGNATGLPVVIGEFHFGALDRGLSATGIRGVSSQQERGKAYRYYLENAVSSKYCVGAHYFQYNDQPALGRFDGENYQIGLVDVCQKPYEDFVTEITECSKNIYDVAAGIKDKQDIMPDIIHPIFF